MMIPSTAYGLAVLLLLVLPGTVYAAVRTKVGGRGPHDNELWTRILWAILASAVLIATYLLVLGDWVIETFTWDGLRNDPRRAGAAGLVLGTLVPAAVAFFVHGKPDWKPNRLPLLSYPSWLCWLPTPQSTTGYESTPTAWDWAAPGKGGTYVRIRLDEAKWVGGWFGRDSFISTYPEQRDIFIEQQFKVDEGGVIHDKVNGTAGVWVTVEPGYVVEWVRPDPLPTSNRKEDNDG